MKVTCDRCHEDFDNVLKEAERKAEGKTIIKTYLECPHCGEQYSICYDSHSTLVLKKQILKQVELLKIIRDEAKYKRKLNNIKKKQKRLGREMTVLGEKYSKYFEEEKES